MLLGCFDIRGYVLGIIRACGSETDLENGGTAKGPVLLLVSHAPSMLDG
jgi:hypothetical protein